MARPPLELYRLTLDRVQEQRGAWPNQTLPRLVAERAGRTPNAVAVDEGTERSITLAEFARLVERVAAGLRKRGVQSGDVVAYQLPTSLDAVVLHYAIAWVGAVASPISLLHREHDLRYMLGLVRPALVVARPEYRGHPFADMLRSVADEIELEGEVLPLAAGELAQVLAGDTPIAPAEADPDAPLYIVWTSGTTGEPKGVVHTHNTGLCGVDRKLRRIQVGEGDAMLVMVPVAHHIGIYAMHMLALAGVRLVLMETWNADRAVELIEAGRATFTSGPPTFLVDLLRCERLGAHDVASLRVFSCGGAPVPPSMVELAQQRLPKCRTLASYGTSEEGYVTSVSPEDPPALSAVSDGRPLDDMQVRILNPDGQALSVDEEGDLVVRTPSCFVAYAHRPDTTREAFLPDSDWRWTGDRAVLRPDGTVRITGRSKDIIIRGGINLPVVQIESALLKHPNVRSVAVVAMPDERLGEKACAFVVPTGTLSLDDLLTTLREQAIAPVYWPERLELIESLPMTASGKVQKFRLRDLIAEQIRAERQSR
jgi:acyl-coenzyme A synthetase/AMP-(fatty) acid ligase